MTDDRWDAMREALLKYANSLVPGDYPRVYDNWEIVQHLKTLGELV